LTVEKESDFEIAKDYPYFISTCCLQIEDKKFVVVDLVTLFGLYLSTEMTSITLLFVKHPYR